MNKSAVILAGGVSSRFGQDKGLLRLANKPLIRHVLDAVNPIVDANIVVVSSTAQAASYVKALDSSINVLTDSRNVQSPLVGASTGFREVREGNAVLLPCDVPFISREIVSFLFELCTDKKAAIPRWPNGYVEPLQAVYDAKSAYEAAEDALKEGKLNMQSMVDKLKGVRYISTLVLQQLDSELETFFNINMPLDLKKAENMLRKNSFSQKRGLFLSFSAFCSVFSCF